MNVPHLSGHFRKLGFRGRIPVVLENRRSSRGKVRTPCTLPLDPPLRFAADCAKGFSTKSSLLH